jgi:hypothetical protein
MLDLFSQRRQAASATIIARVLYRLERSGAQWNAAMIRRTRRAGRAGVDPRTVERSRALLGCAVRGVDPAPFAAPSERTS